MSKHWISNKINRLQQCKIEVHSHGWWSPMVIWVWFHDSIEFYKIPVLNKISNFLRYCFRFIKGDNDNCQKDINHHICACMSICGIFLRKLYHHNLYLPLLFWCILYNCFYLFKMVFKKLTFCFKKYIQYQCLNEYVTITFLVNSWWPPRINLFLL